MTAVPVNAESGPASGRVRFALRALWVAIRLAGAFIFLKEGGTFFYQGF